MSGSIFAAKSKSFEEDKSWGGKLPEHQTPVVWYPQPPRDPGDGAPGRLPGPCCTDVAER